MEELQNFISNYTQLSFYRGIDPANPVDFVVQPDTDNPEVWTLVASYTEPTFSRIPYNVLWIPMDLADVNHGKVLRRVSHENSSFTYRSEWEVIADYDGLFTQPQYWQSVLEDLSVIGIESPNQNLPVATTSAIGIAYLQPNDPDDEGVVDPVQPIGVLEDDVRMTNDRYPNYHEHPDYARTMIKINDTQWARVDRAFPLLPGQTLHLDFVNPNNPDEWIASWRYPKQDSIQFVDRSLVYIEIRGDTSILEQNTKTYEVWGIFADGESRKVDPQVWAVTQNTEAASLNPVSGVLTSANVETSTTIRMEASYTEKGITRSAFLDVQVIAIAELTSLEIVGPTSVASGSTTPYQVLAGFSDGSFVNVTPATFTSSNPDTSTDTSKILVVDQIFVDSTTQLAATFTINGVTLSATLDVALAKELPKPMLLEIIGASSINERTSETYTFRVVYNDNSEDTKTSVNVFNKQSGPASLTVAGSIATVGALTADASGVLFASYTENGATVTDTHPVTLVNLNLAASLAVRESTLAVAQDPAETGDPDSGAWIVLEDGTLADPSDTVPGTDVSWGTASSFGNIDAAYRGDVLPASNIRYTTEQHKARWPYRRSVQVTATKSVPGIGNLTGSRDVYVNPPRLLDVKLVPAGQDPATFVMPADATTLNYNENTTVNVGVWFQIETIDSVTNAATQEWVQHAPISAPNVPAAWGTINLFERSITLQTATTTVPVGTTPSTMPGTIPVVVGNVSADTAGFLRLNIKHNPASGIVADPNTVDITVELKFTVKQVEAQPTALRIRVAGGPNANSSSHNEETDIELYYEAQFSDAPTTWVNVTNHPGLVAALGTPNHGSVLTGVADLQLGSVTGNQAMGITASLTNAGATVNASYTVTILDTTPYINSLRVRLAKDPSSAGSSSTEDENQTLGLVYFVDYTNAVGTWVAVDPDTVGSALGVTLGTPNGATLQSNNKQIVLPDVTGNKTVSVNATYTENGVTKTGSYTITIRDTTVYLNSIKVRLAKAPNAATNASMEDENQSLGLVFTADYTDSVGTFVPIAVSDTGLIVSLGTPANGATLTGKDLLNLPDVTGNQNVTVNASYTVNGVTKTGSYVVTMRDTTIYLNAFRIRLASAPNATTNTSTHNENQTIAVVYQAQFSDAPSTWVDVSANPAVTAAIVAPTNGVTLPTKTQVQLPDVSANVSSTLRGSFTFGSTTLQADYIFNITNIVITPLELRIRLAANPSAGTNTSTHDENQNITMIYQARLSNAVGTWVNVSADSGLTASVVAPTNGVTMAADKVTITLPDVSGNKTTNLAASLTMNGTTVNATYVINITDTTPPAGITPRWGYAPKVNLLTDYQNASFYDLLNKPLTGVNGEQFTATTVNGAPNDPTTLYAYMMYPASWGWLYIVNQSGQAGQFDGAGISISDATGQPVISAWVGGIEYYVYRQSNPFTGTRTYTVNYGSSDPRSGVQ